MKFQNAETEQAWVALTQAEHARVAKAWVYAKEAAFLDLPRNEQVRYFDWAYAAIKQEEYERSN